MTICHNGWIYKVVQAVSVVIWNKSELDRSMCRYDKLLLPETVRCSRKKLWCHAGSLEKGLSISPTYLYTKDLVRQGKILTQKQLFGIWSLLMYKKCWFFLHCVLDQLDMKQNIRTATANLSQARSHFLRVSCRKGFRVNVKQSHNVSFKPIIPQKNERTNSFFCLTVL